MAGAPAISADPLDCLDVVFGLTVDDKGFEEAKKDLDELKKKVQESSSGSKFDIDINGALAAIKKLKEKFKEVVNYLDAIRKQAVIDIYASVAPPTTGLSSKQYANMSAFTSTEAAEIMGFNKESAVRSMEKISQWHAGINKYGQLDQNEVFGLSYLGISEADMNEWLGSGDPVTLYMNLMNAIQSKMEALHTDKKGRYKEADANEMAELFMHAQNAGVDKDMLYALNRMVVAFKRGGGRAVKFSQLFLDDNKFVDDAVAIGSKNLHALNDELVASERKMQKEMRTKSAIQPVGTLIGDIFNRVSEAGTAILQRVGEVVDTFFSVPGIKELADFLGISTKDPVYKMMRAMDGSRWEDIITLPAVKGAVHDMVNPHEWYKPSIYFKEHGQAPLSNRENVFDMGSGYLMSGAGFDGVFMENSGKALDTIGGRINDELGEDGSGYVDAKRFLDFYMASHLTWGSGLNMEGYIEPVLKRIWDGLSPTLQKEMADKFGFTEGNWQAGAYNTFLDWWIRGGKGTEDDYQFENLGIQASHEGLSDDFVTTLMDRVRDVASLMADDLAKTGAFDNAKLKVEVDGEGRIIMNTFDEHGNKLGVGVMNYTVNPDFKTGAARVLNALNPYGNGIDK